MGTEFGSIIERKARIFNVQKYSIYDGPGIRTLIFFKGCPLRCKWCSNPEGLERKYQVMFQEDLCIDCGNCISVCPAQIHEMNSSLATNGARRRHRVNRSMDCIGCKNCEAVCPKRAISIAGDDKTISDVLEIIQQDAIFYQSSGGGVTLGGGEATAQPEFAANLLMECKRMGIHTALETCGYTKQDSLLQIAKFTDLILFDIKHIDADRHYELTGVRNERILENLAELIQRGFHVRIRMPLIKGLNDHEDVIRRTMAYLQPFRRYKGLQGIDLLPYHKLGVNKYKQLDMRYTITEDLSFEQDELLRLEKLVRDYGLQAKVLRH